MARPSCIVLLFFLFFGMFNTTSQEIKIFKVSDFDLRGNVKSCLVITNYGKEEYEFDTIGRLTKSITRFSETDYDITYYKFKEDELVERRMENYRDGEFEPSTSFANFYSVDQEEPRIVTEKIFSYNKEPLDSYRYHYDAAENLVKIVRSGPNGEDETTIDRTGEGKHRQETYFLNGVIQKTETTTFGEEGKRKTVLNTNYVDGIRNSAIETVYDDGLKLISKTEMGVDKETKKLFPQKVENFEYDEMGELSAVHIEEGNSKSSQEYIYQYDDAGLGNWVKQIITPDNLYTTRRIEYYPEASAQAPSKQ